MNIREKLVIWLMKNVKISVTTIVGICNTLDKDEDGYISFGELIHGVFNVIRK